MTHCTEGDALIVLLAIQQRKYFLKAVLAPCFKMEPHELHVTAPNRLGIARMTNGKINPAGKAERNPIPLSVSLHRNHRNVQRTVLQPRKVRRSLCLLRPCTEEKLPLGRGRAASTGVIKEPGAQECGPVLVLLLMALIPTNDCR